MKDKKVEDIDNLDFFPETDGISPTNLNNNNIETFGQENMPFTVDTNKGLNSITYENTKKIDEYISIGNTPAGDLTERTKKKKDTLPRNFILIAVGILILIIGIGLFFFLRSSKNVAISAVKTKKIEVSIGDKLSLNLDDYATFKNIQATNCILNISGVDTSKVGDYTYYISCGVNKYDGKISVVDKTAPDVQTKFVVKTSNDEIKVDDFIISCEDVSGCTYSLTNLDDLAKNRSKIGMYTANIEVSDKADNKKTVTEDLIISDYNIKFMDICSKTISSPDFSGSYYIKDYIAYDESNVARYIKSYVTAEFDNSDEYDEYSKKISDGKLTLNSLNGTASVDGNNSMITISSYQNTSDVLGFYTEYDDINNSYIFNGYSCNKYNN